MKICDLRWISLARIRSFRAPFPHHRRLILCSLRLIVHALRVRSVPPTTMHARTERIRNASMIVSAAPLASFQTLRSLGHAQRALLGAARTGCRGLLHVKIAPQAALRTKLARHLASSAAWAAASFRYRSHAMLALRDSLVTQKPALCAKIVLKVR